MILTLEEDSVDIDIPSLRKELDGYFEIMQDFSSGDARQNLMYLSAFTARISHVRSHIIRSAGGKLVQDFRTKEIDPFVSECDRQFKIWSRLITYAQFDWETSRGGY